MCVYPGLYDSIILGKSPEEQPVSYADEPLLWDKQFQLDLISKLAKVCDALQCMHVSYLLNNDSHLLGLLHKLI